MGQDRNRKNSLGGFCESRLKVDEGSVWTMEWLANGEQLDSGHILMTEDHGSSFSSRNFLSQHKGSNGEENNVHSSCFSFNVTSLKRRYLNI